MLDSLFDFDAAIYFLTHLEWYWVLTFAFIVTLVENLFPPSPSDSVLVFIGSLVALGTVKFIPLLVAASLGSLAGFVIMYYLGYFFGHRVVDSNRIKFINQKDLEKPEKWFRQYGYYLIIANRFLSGTRAVIAFFAGMSELTVSKTIILSLLSALLWNAILIYLGIVFGDNYESIIDYISLYGKIIFPIALIGIGLFIWYKIKNNGKVDK